MGGAGAASLADAGIAFSANFAGVVSVGVASLTDAVMALPADLVRVVTVCVAPLADAGLVTVGVTSLADAMAASLADAGMVLPADPAGLAAVCVADLADDGVLLCAAPVAVVNGPEYSGDLICWGDQTLPLVETPELLCQSYYFVYNMCVSGGGSTKPMVGEGLSQSFKVSPGCPVVWGHFV